MLQQISIHHFLWQLSLWSHFYVKTNCFYPVTYGVDMIAFVSESTHLVGTHFCRLENILTNSLIKDSLGFCTSVADNQLQQLKLCALRPVDIAAKPEVCGFTFLAHLCTKWSGWAIVTGLPPSACVICWCRPSTLSLKHLLWNCSLDFDKSLQEKYLCGPLLKMFKRFQLVA